MKTKTQFTNRILSLVLALVLVLGMMPLNVLTVSAAEAAADITVTIDTGASVTLKDTDSDGYYEIGTADELYAFAAAVNGGNRSANAKLTADISLSGQSRPWIPISFTQLDSEAYNGIFDGQGHTISNLYFNDSEAFTAGLFGYVDGGTVRNTIVADSYVAAIWGGAIAGRFFGTGKIEGCGNLNTTVALGEAGGIVGMTDSSVIACWNTGNISGDTWAGGICSYLSGSVKGCWNTGEISGERCGGIVGAIGGGRTVVYCYNNGMVNASDSDLEGAIIGSNNGSSTPKMANCYFYSPLGGAYYAFEHGEKRDYEFNNVKKLSSSILATGECALFLNQGLAGTGYQYYQNLDNGKTVDAYPVTDSSHGTVHRGYKVCSDVISYSNSPLSSTIYHSGVKYQIDNLTVWEACTNENCTVSAGLGSVTLQAADPYYYTGSPIPNPITGSFVNGTTYKVTYSDSETAPSAIGEYNVTLIVYDKGGTEQVRIAKYVEIKYLPSPGSVNFLGYSYQKDGVYWFKDGTVAEVMPPEGYGISKTLNGSYTASVSFAQGDTATIHLKRYSDGAMTDAIDLSNYLEWDTTAPEGTVKLPSGNFWTQLVKKNSFRFFFKDAKSITITAQDNDSGVKSIQYFYSFEDLINVSSLNTADAIAKLETAIGDDWEDYNGPFALEQDGKYIVYAKITDNVGSVTYISSDGIVIYSDATSSNANITTTYKAGEDREISVELNGNTVNEVTCDDALLAATDYTVSDGKITLKAEYLDTLAAGEYTVAISVNPMGCSYEDYDINDKPLDLVIILTANPKPVTVPTADTEDYVYDGSEHTYDITPSAWYTVTGNKKIDAGTYTVVVALKDKDNTVWTDGTTADKTYTFHIEKKTVDLSGVKWDYRAPFRYDGLTHGVAIDESTLPEGASVSNYTGHSGTDTGRRRAAAAITYDANHTGEGTLFLDWEIVNNWTPAEYTVSAPNGNGWLNSDFVITAADGYMVSLTNTADSDWKDALTYSGETADGSVTFYLKNETDGTISLAKTVTYKLDKTAPTGKVAFVNRNAWEEFVNTITFGLFFKDEVTVKATANDTLSGVDKIEYASADKAMTLDEVKAITDWTEYTDSFGVTLEDAKTFVYFVRITDKAGNVTYLSTDGAEYDTTAPVIDGVENGKTYYTTQKVTVMEKNVDTITLNGNPATENITLAGNKEATYTIVVTDKAGNTTTVTVTMKPIKALASATENLGNDNVTSADAPALNELVEKLSELIADPDTSDDGEKETLEQHKTIAESLLETIEAAAEATDTENTEKVENVTPENVTPENKTDLENAKADLEKALEDNGGNYTEDEKKAIEDEIKRIDEALEVIGNVEVVEDTVSKLPAVDTVKPDDEEAIKAITDAQTAYNALSDYEKSLVDEAAKANLDKLVAALVAYDIVEGDGSSWTEDSNHNITFVVNGLFSKFVGIKVDGKDVDKANYEVKAGSTIITLKASYLDTFAVGEHTITVVYTDGSTDGTFNVHAKANSPATGDDFNPAASGSPKARRT